jgi:hypothetical protein
MNQMPIASGFSLREVESFIARSCAPVMHQDVLITNDKFCMSRFGRLKLSRRKRPFEFRGDLGAEPAYPPGEISHHGGEHDTSMESLPSGETTHGRAASMGSGLPVSSALVQPDTTGTTSDDGDEHASNSGGVK